MVQSEAGVLPRFCVLLATYNGMRWIDEQVSSILNQQNVSVRVVVSDDQSSDGTWEWLQKLADSDSRVQLLPRSERFGGAAKNFFRLLRDTDFADCDYVGFADQDDIWLVDKLHSAHLRLTSDNYAAYSGNVLAFYPDGREQLIDKAQPQCRYDFLFEAAGPGCSYVLRVKEASAFKGFMATHWNQVNELALHDWTIYAWFRANGLRWFIDPEYKMRYRQHASNQVGANEGFRAMRARYAMIRSGWYRAEIRKIASLVGSKVPEVSPRMRASGQVSRLFLIRHVSQMRRRMRDRVFFFVFVMLGLY